MLTREIKYVDINTEQETVGTFRFQLTEAEIMELEYEEKTKFTDILERISKAENQHEVVALFKRIILMAYGIRHPEGYFDKSPEISRKFSLHPAYNALWLECVTVENAGADFVMGILPKGMATEKDQVSAKMRQLPSNPSGEMPKPPTS